MNHFPLFASLKGRPVLVVGGGAVAARKIAMLHRAGARVRVAAARLGAEVRALVQAGGAEQVAGAFAPELLDTVFLAVAATDDAALNRAVYEAAEARQRLVNVVDCPELCSFIFPAVIDRSPLQMAVSSDGQAPVLARLWREKLEAQMPQYLGEMARTAGAARAAVKAKLPGIGARRRFWEALFADAQFHRLHAAGRSGEAAAHLSAVLEGRGMPQGSVALVGAGPGDAGLLTLKALQSIQAADVVLYDALVSEAVLDLVRRDAEKVCVGKRAGSHSVRQEETNRLLVEYARQGKRVVRLKGGDPFVFGRGGEELEVLEAAGIPFEVVPGITAALGATAYAGIPLTHREHAQTAIFVTGHCRPEGSEPNWPLLAQGNQTLVVYMGTIKAAELAAGLIRHGRAPDTPAAVISQGTLPAQQVFSGSLDTLPELAAAAAAPALIVIGETAALRHRLAWFGHAPAQAGAGQDNTGRQT